LVTVPKTPFAIDRVAFADVFEVSRASDDAEEILPALKGRRFDAVIPAGEFSVILADRIASALGCPHNPLDRVHAYRDKVAMRASFMQAGVSQPRILAVFASMEEADRFPWHEVRFPVVVKPVDLAGSLHVRLCDSVAAVKQTLRRIFLHKSSFSGLRFAARSIVEEVATGDEYSAECVVEDGALLEAFVVRKFVSDPPACDELAHVCGVRLVEPLGRQLRDDLARIIAAWGVRAGILHVEFKIADGRISFIEAGCRVAGGNISNLVELSWGINLEEAFIRARAGLSNRGELETCVSHPTLHAVKFLFPASRKIEPPAGVEVVASKGPEPGREAGSGLGVDWRIGYRIVCTENRAVLADYVGEFSTVNSSLDKDVNLLHLHHPKHLLQRPMRGSEAPLDG
jgi:biotin carboxylase